jgi:solute carrier family 25 S-adenosylmethionine transporter 26
MISLAAAFFTTYEGLKKLIQKSNPTRSGSSSPLVPQPFIDSAASSVAELVSCLILTPAEVLKQNAQMIQKPEHSKSSIALKDSATMKALKTFKKPSQLFRGYTALAARNLPFTAMQFPMFERLKMSIKNYRKQQGTATESLWETGIVTSISAGSAGSFAAVITTPVDVVKTRIMLSASGKVISKEASEGIEKAVAKGNNAAKLSEQKGVAKKAGIAVVKEVIKENGVKGLFRGAMLRSVWTAVGSGLYLGIYESGRVWLGDRRN